MSDFAIAKMIGGNISVLNLPRVPVHRQEQARTILQAQYEAKVEIAKQMNQNKKEPFPFQNIVLPDF